VNAIGTSDPTTGGCEARLDQARRGQPETCDGGEGFKSAAAAGDSGCGECSHGR
jgi:hypothetical protein